MDSYLLNLTTVCQASTLGNDDGSDVVAAVTDYQYRLNIRLCFQVS